MCSRPKRRTGCDPSPPEWHERYDRRTEDYRLPRGREARLAYAATVGDDGEQLLAALTAETAPEALAQLPAVDVLRRSEERRVGKECRDRWQTLPWQTDNGQGSS